MHSILCTTIVFLLFVVSASTNVFAEGNDNLVGRPAPQFRLPDLNGTARPAVSQKIIADSSHALIISFFSVTCVPCYKELPYLNRLSDSLAADGLQMVAVCVDSVWEASQVKMISDLKLSCHVVSGSTGILAKRYGVGNALPYSIYIDRRGIVRSVITGFSVDKTAEIDSSVAEILKH